MFYIVVHTKIAATPHGDFELHSVDGINWLPQARMQAEIHRRVTELRQILVDFGEDEFLRALARNNEWYGCTEMDRPLLSFGNILNQPTRGHSQAGRYKAKHRPIPQRERRPR